MEGERISQRPGHWRVLRQFGRVFAGHSRKTQAGIQSAYALVIGRRMQAAAVTTDGSTGLVAGAGLDSTGRPPDGSHSVLNWAGSLRQFGRR
jgi:hypothetical protein